MTIPSPSRNIVDGSGTEPLSARAIANVGRTSGRGPDGPAHLFINRMSPFG